MAYMNTYLQYKRDQKLLVYWIIHASNSIIKSFPSHAPAVEDTTGELRLSTLISLSALIAKHISPIPTTIYRLLQSIISSREGTHALFQRIVANNPDPDIEKSNISHKYWIDGLTEAFKALGGEVWVSRQKGQTEGADEEDEDEVIFSNHFSVLSLDGEEKEEEGDEEDEAKGGIEDAPKRPKTKSTKEGKKGKRGKKPKGKEKREPKLNEIPLEHYRIIEDEAWVVEYLMAASSLASQWVRLRHYLQGIWYQVAYDGLNSVAAGAVCNMAVGMISNTELGIFC